MQYRRSNEPGQIEGEEHEVVFRLTICQLTFNEKKMCIMTSGIPCGSDVTQALKTWFQ